MPIRSLLLLLLAVAFAVTSGGLAPVRAADQGPFVIPSISSMTGSGAFIGKENEETLRRLETAVNRQGGIKGRPIHFEVYDDQGNRKSRCNCSIKSWRADRRSCSGRA